jgi:hypothetical protein
MTESKKHSPQQSEDRTETILGQVPDSKLEDLIVGLVDLANSRSSPSSPSSQASSPNETVVLNPPSPYKKKS